MLRLQVHAHAQLLDGSGDSNLGSQAYRTSTLTQRAISLTLEVEIFTNSNENGTIENMVTERVKDQQAHQ